MSQRGLKYVKWTIIFFSLQKLQLLKIILFLQFLLPQKATRTYLNMCENQWFIFEYASQLKCNFSTRLNKLRWFPLNNLTKKKVYLHFFYFFEWAIHLFIRSQIRHMKKPLPSIQILGLSYSTWGQKKCFFTPKGLT